MATPLIHNQIQIESVINGEFVFIDDYHTKKIFPAENLLIMPEHRHSWKCIKPGYMIGSLIQVAGPDKDEFISVLKNIDGFFYARKSTWSVVVSRNLRYS